MRTRQIFRTYKGHIIHPLAPDPNAVDIDDIARSLSQQCRFLGHTQSFYSVAQHSVLVSEAVPHEDALWGLLHDASEAYLCDLPAPIKREPEMATYRVAEERVMACIAFKFGFPSEMPASVAEADKILLATEFRDVTSVDDLNWIVDECGCRPWHKRITAWPPAVAEDRFLTRFRELTQ